MYCFLAHLVSIIVLFFLTHPVSMIVLCFWHTLPLKLYYMFGTPCQYNCATFLAHTVSIIVLLVSEA